MVRGGKVALIHIPPTPHPTPRDLPTFFTWESPSPFQMLPITGLLEPGQACRIKVTFQPPMAVIYEAQATCWYGEGSKQKSGIQLQAVGEARPLTRPQSPPLTSLGNKASSVLLPPPPWPGPQGTSISLPPFTEPHRLCHLFASRGAADQCSPGDPCLP